MPDLEEGEVGLGELGEGQDLLWGQQHGGTGELRVIWASVGHGRCEEDRRAELAGEGREVWWVGSMTLTWQCEHRRVAGLVVVGVPGRGWRGPSAETRPRRCPAPDHQTDRQESRGKQGREKEEVSRKSMYVLL